MLASGKNTQTETCRPHCSSAICSKPGDGGKGLKSSWCLQGSSLEVFKTAASLEVFKKHRDVALRDMMVGGHGGDGLMVGLDDLSCLFQFNDAMIL